MNYWYKTLKLNWRKTTYALILSKSWDRLGITFNWAPKVPAAYTSNSLTKVIQKSIRNTNFRYWLVFILPAKYAQQVCPYHILTPSKEPRTRDEKAPCVFCGKLIHDWEKLLQKSKASTYWTWNPNDDHCRGRKV